MSQMTETYPWRCLSCNRINKKLAVICAQCHAHWTSGIRHNTEPKNVTSSQHQWQSQSWQNWTDQGADWNWQDNRSSSRKPSRKPNRSVSQGRNQGQFQGPRPVSPRPNKGKGKNQNKGKGNSGKFAQQPMSMVPKAMQPFGHNTAGDQALITGGSQSMGTANTMSTGTQIQAQNHELVNALRKAYPNADSTPVEVKELIEKTEQNLARSITTNIHASTRALSKAQRTLQDVTEARRKHRGAWMEYLKDGLQAWETSLEGYRRHQAALQEAAASARADIAAARHAIESNAKAAEDPSMTRVVLQQPIREELEEAGQDEHVDQEEKK